MKKQLYLKSDDKNVYEKLLNEGKFNINYESMFILQNMYSCLYLRPNKIECRN